MIYILSHKHAHHSRFWNDIIVEYESIKTVATSVTSQTTDRYENDKNNIADKKTKYFE